MKDLNLLKQISGRIKELYTFHDYPITKDNIVKLTGLFFEVKPDLDYEYVDKFITEVESGKYGILYKMPTCLMSMFRQYVANHTRITFNYMTESQKKELGLC